MKEIQAREVAAIKMQMQLGELKLNPWTLNDFQKISISWIDSKILPLKQEESAQISQQVWLNLNIGCKSCSTSNWYSRLCGDTIGPLGRLGLAKNL